MEKTCSKCKTKKELTEFFKNKKAKDGHRSECRECEKETNKLYYENNKRKILEREKLYRENNREKELKRQKLYYQNNKRKILERKKLYRENNKEKISETNKLYYENNKEKQLLRHARQRAKKKDLPFSLMEEDITIPNTCPVLNIPIFSGEGVMCDNSPNLDRIIPEKGYVAGNVRVISQRANRIKSNATAEEIKLVWEDLLRNERNKNENQ